MTSEEMFELHRLRAEVERLRGGWEMVAGQYDDLLQEASHLRAEVERLKVERDEQVQWVKDLADDLIKAEAEIERLRAALKRARDDMEAWGGYASEYFREKHDLNGDLAAIAAALTGQEKT